MMISVPSSATLDQAANSIELIRLLATTDGLKEALESLSAERKALEDKEADLRGREVALQDDSAKLEIWRASLQQSQNDIGSREKAVIERENSAMAKAAELGQREKQLAFAQENFDDAVRKQTAALNKREDAVALREVAATDLMNAAEAKGAEYDGKLQKLRDSIA